MYLQVPDHQVHNHTFSSMKQSTHSYLKGLDEFYSSEYQYYTNLMPALSMCIESIRCDLCKVFLIGEQFQTRCKKGLADYSIGVNEMEVKMFLMTQAAKFCGYMLRITYSVGCTAQPQNRQFIIFVLPLVYQARPSLTLISGR